MKKARCRLKPDPRWTCVRVGRLGLQRHQLTQAVQDPATARSVCISRKQQWNWILRPVSTESQSISESSKKKQHIQLNCQYYAKCKSLEFTWVLLFVISDLKSNLLDALQPNSADITSMLYSKYSELRNEIQHIMSSQSNPPCFSSSHFPSERSYLLRSTREPSIMKSPHYLQVHCVFTRLNLCVWCEFAHLL